MLPRFIKSKKGFALESAILFMVAIFSFCFLLSTLTISGHNRVKLEKIKMENDINLDYIVEDYLAYIEGVIVPPAETSAQETTKSPEETTKASETTKTPETTKAPETTAAQTKENADAQQQVDEVPVDISYEYPLLSPLSNADGGNNQSETEKPATDAETTAAESTEETVPLFEQYLANQEIEKFATYDYENYSYKSEVKPRNGEFEFTLEVTHIQSNTRVLAMRVIKRNIANFISIEVVYINKAPVTQNNP